MKDLFFASLALFVCASPIVALIALAMFLRRRSVNATQLVELELEVARLRGDVQILAAQVAQVRVSPGVTVPVAPMPGASPEAVLAPAVPEPVVASSEPIPTVEQAAGGATSVMTPDATSGAFASEETPEQAWAAATVEPALPDPSRAPVRGVPPLPPQPFASDTLPPEPPADEEGGLERWLGVRGAAVLGALILVLAGFYFFQYSITHGLIGPLMRIVLGTLVGVGAIVVSEWPLRTRSPALSNALAWAGVGVLYTAFWAAHAVFHLVPSWVAGLLLVLVTATCALLAIRRDAPSIAVLGLLGGFATPLALSTGADRPIPLFAYLLLLDVALLALARKKRWPLLGVGALVATAIYQLLWLSMRMDAPRTWLGVGIVFVFGLLFTLFPFRSKAQEPGAPEERDASVVALRIGAVAVPFLLALSFVARARLTEQLWELGALLVVLSVGAALVGWRERVAWIGLGAVGGALGLLALWLQQHRLTVATTWQLVGTFVLVTAAHQLGLELARRRSGVEGGGGETDTVAPWLAAAAASILGMGLLGLTVTNFRVDVGVPALSRLVPYVVGHALLASFAVRQAGFPGRGWLHVVLGAVLPFALAFLDAMGGMVGGFPEGLTVGLLVAGCVALGLVAALRRLPETRGPADLGAALAATLGLFALAARTAALATWVFLAGSVVLALLTLLAAARRSSGGPAIAGLFALAVAFSSRTVGGFWRAPLGAELVAMAGLVLLFAGWPLLAGARYRSRASSWRAAALSGIALFLPMRFAWLRELGDGYVGALAVGLAAVTLGAALLARRVGPSDPAQRRASIVWLAAATASFVTLAVPLQLENEWLTIGWALEAVALLALERRLDHAGLRWLAMALFAAVATRLLLNPYVLGYYARSELRIVNWLSYTYLVPAACFVAGAALLGPTELARRRPWERGLLPARPVLAPILATGALLAVFAWINLTIVDWYATGPRLSIPTERMPARDLTLSIAWALYALVLLGLGLWRASTAARFASLGLLVITCGKVFLYDLGHLRDLYRVAALVGLAFSLLFVSLVYSRLLFRVKAAGKEGRS
jgi:uncharacterized membrane protein